MITLLNCFAVLLFFLIDFPDEKLLFKKEMSNKLYSPFSYLVAKCLVSFPITIFFAIIPVKFLYFR